MSSPLEYTIALRGRFYQMRWIHDGKPTRKSLKTADLNEAHRRAQAQLAAPAAAVEPISISQAIARSEKLSTVREGTALNRKRAFDLLVAFFGDVPISILDRHEVLRWRTHLETERALESSTINKLMSAARSVVGVLLDARKVADNPFAGIKGLPENNRVRFMEWEDCARLLDEAPRPTIHLAIVLALYAGYRLSEILRADWSHFDWDKGRLWVDGVKTEASAEWVPLHDALLAAVAPFKKDTGRLVELSAHQLWRELRYLARRAGVTLPAKTAWHALRHSFAVHLQDLGYTQAQIARLLRHKNTKTVHRYADVRAVTPKIGAF